MQNTSGQGKESIVPEEIKGWNWGAMLMNWVWGLFNGTFIALLMFVPFVNFVMFFMLGAKGNEWAWRNKKWDSVEHFKSVQRKWAIAGLVILVLGVGAGVIGGMMAPTVTE
ncbi:MAG: ribonuclease G [Burkholderiales bacterium PBB3]|nr:MAG: ribonuclease G [Burkholderiales bacterium PBB3]